MQSSSNQNNQALLYQMLSSQFASAPQAYNQMSQGYIQPQNIGMLPQINNQSLILLQRIIQTTPEIQVLHKQEQLALYQIQQNIKTALSQNLGQEVISHLVLEYQKTQEQHQHHIQEAIQRKLTLILLQSNPQYVNNFTMSSQNEYSEQPDEPHIENNVFKYSRSSYHLGIAYYIYNKKKTDYDMQQKRAQQMGQNTQGQMMLQSMMQSLNPMQNSASPPSMNQKIQDKQQNQNMGQGSMLAGMGNGQQKQVVSNVNLTSLKHSVKNEGQDINSRVDDLMNL